MTRNSMIAADLILTNGNLITQNDRAPLASAMAIHRGRIEAVGSNAEILALANPHTRRIDLAGQTVVPGFQDCHIHLLWSGKLLTRQADLVGSASIDEILSRLSDFVSRTDGWIQGHGFDQDKIREKRFPTRTELDRVSSNRPILITRVCGHAAVVNSAALETVSPEQRRSGEESTGLYTENAISPFIANIPELDDAQLEEALLAIMRHGLRSGITSVQTMLDSPDQLQAYTRLRRKLGKLPIRVVAMPPEKSADVLHAHGIATGFGDEWLRIGAVKFFSDGSLGARTALLASPYADDPSKIGERLYDPDAFKRRARAVQNMGFQLAIHAIGDQALRETIDAIEFALDGEDNHGHRHRIEHASICPPDLLTRMATLQIATTLQPQFVTSDTWTGERVGKDRIGWCYPFKSMIDAGIPCGLSSDCPVEKFDAFECLNSVLNRHPWNPGDRLSIEEALKAYCLGSAYCAHREQEMGSLEPGKFADFVVLTGNPLNTPADKIRDLRADRVFVGGEEVLL